eukprot:350535-Chlamydomonas_euryale.AAC.4
MGSAAKLPALRSMRRREGRVAVWPMPRPVRDRRTRVTATAPLGQPFWVESCEQGGWFCLPPPRTHMHTCTVPSMRAIRSRPPPTHTCTHARCPACAPCAPAPAGTPPAARQTAGAPGCIEPSCRTRPCTRPPAATRP